MEWMETVAKMHAREYPFFAVLVFSTYYHVKFYTSLTACCVCVCVHWQERWIWCGRYGMSTRRKCNVLQVYGIQNLHVVVFSMNMVSLCSILITLSIVCLTSNLPSYRIQTKQGMKQFTLHYLQWSQNHGSSSSLRSSHHIVLFVFGQMVGMTAFTFTPWYLEYCRLHIHIYI